MASITKVGRVMVPVADQDTAIAFYREKLGFEVVADVPFGEGDRWVEVGPPDGGAAVALVPPRGDYQPGRHTGIAFESTDVRAAHEEFVAKGVEIDGELMGGDGTVPLLFFFRDADRNVLMLGEASDRA